MFLRVERRRIGASAPAGRPRHRPGRQPRGSVAALGCGEQAGASRAISRNPPCRGRKADVARAATPQPALCTCGARCSSVRNVTITVALQLPPIESFRQHVQRDTCACTCSRHRVPDCVLGPVWIGLHSGLRGASPRYPTDRLWGICLTFISVFKNRTLTLIKSIPLLRSFFSTQTFVAGPLVFLFVQLTFSWFAVHKGERRATGIFFCVSVAIRPKTFALLGTIAAICFVESVKFQWLQMLNVAALCVRFTCSLSKRCFAATFLFGTKLNDLLFFIKSRSLISKTS